MSDSPSNAPEHTPDDERAPERAAGFTVDLSSGDRGSQPQSWRRKRKTASPVLTKIVDLSTPADAAPQPPESGAAAPAAKSPRRQKKQEKRNERRRDPAPSGNALADLLDPETLARLRGNDPS